MATVGTLIVDLRANVAKFEANMKRATSGIDKFGKKMSSIGKSLSLKMTAPIAGVAAISLKAASDAEEMEGKFSAVFGGMSAEVKKWAAVQALEVNRSRFALMEYLSQLQDTFVPMGLARDKAADLSKQVATLAIDLASFNNRAEPEVVNALTSALVGNHEAVRQFGVVITEASLKAELLNMGIKGGTEAASEQQKMLARLNIIMKSTKDAQGDAVRTAGSFANQMRGLKAAVQDVAIEIGQMLMPHARTFVAWAKNATEWLKKLNPEKKKMVLIVAALVAAIGPLLVVLGSMAAGIVALASPIGIAVAAIAGMTAAWLAWGDDMKRVVREVYEGIKFYLVDQFQALVDTIGEKVEAIKDFFKSAHGDIIGGSYVPDIIKGIEQWFDKLDDVMVRPTGDATSTVSSYFESMADRIASSLTNIIAEGQNFKEQMLSLARDLAKSSLQQGISYFLKTALGLPGRQHGGPVAAGRPYQVGERGPEVFVPRTSGTIVPNQSLGGVTVVYNIDARGADAGVEGRIERALRRTKAEAIQEAVQKVGTIRRRGGSPARSLTGG